MQEKYLRKDDRWLEAPGFCVECGELRPIDRSAVCENCWLKGPNFEYEDWHEDIAMSRCLGNS